MDMADLLTDGPAPPPSSNAPALSSNPSQAILKENSVPNTARPIATARGGAAQQQAAATPAQQQANSAAEQLKRQRRKEQEHRLQELAEEENNKQSLEVRPAFSSCPHLHTALALAHF